MKVRILSPLHLTAYLCITLLGSSCKKQDVNEAHAAQQMPPPEVTVAKPDVEDLIEWDEYTGRIEATQRVSVSARVTGHLAEIHIKSGQKVKEGDLLFVIDQRSFKATLAHAEATRDKAHVSVQLAQQAHDRAQRLLKNNAISKEEADTREANLAEAVATLKSAEAQVEIARLDLQYTEVRAPVDGRVSRELVTVGNYISGAAGFTTELTTLVSDDPVYAYTDVDEASYLRYKKLVREKVLENLQDGKLPAEVHLSDETEFKHKGVVESFDNQLNPGTGSIILRALIPNPDGVLTPGNFCKIRIPSSNPKKTILISERAVGTDQGKAFVYVIGQDNMATPKHVTLGRRHGERRVVLDGLTENDVIVTEGFAKIRGVMPVNPQMTTSQLPAVEAVTP